MIDEMKAAIGKAKVPVAEKVIDPAIVSEVEAKMYAPLAEAMRIKDKLANYAQVDEVIDGTSPASARRRPREGGRRRRSSRTSRRRCCATRCSSAACASTGAPSTRSAPIWTQVGVIPRTHGSAVFTRGETQALVTTTLGTSDDQQKIETVAGETYKRFMLHYNFPPFSVGEVAFMRGPGRARSATVRCERALAPMMPAEEQFPVHRPRGVRHPRVERLLVDGQRLRRLALDDGRRVPLKAPVAGIAMAS